MDVGPIVKVFDALMTAGATLGLGATGFFVMLAGYQFAIVIMCKVIANLIGGALGAPGAGGTTTGLVLAPTAWMLSLPG